MEEARVKTKVNVLAISEKDPNVSFGRRRVISVQKALTEVSGLKKAEVCLGVLNQTTLTKMGVSADSTSLLKIRQSLIN